jgi:peptide/nickel transport system substrate-binding protein
MRIQYGRAWCSAVACIVAALVAVGLAAPAEVAAQKSGGTLRIAILGEPPALDPHWTTATLTEIITGHYLEGLYTRDKSYQPIPMLAEGHTVSADNKVYTIRLRHGVIFHNGKEMTSEDVVASLNRWLKVATYGKALAPKVEAVRATDKYAIEIQLKEPSAVLIPNLAFENNFAAIYPKEVAEAAGDKPNTQFIGTGPFKIVDRQPDRFIKMVRHDKYTARSDPATGWGGKKVAYVDTLMWIPTPDPVQRINAVESGEADFTFDATADAYGRLKDNPNVRTEISKPYYWLVMVFNKKKGIFADDTPAGKKMRQAVLAAIDQEPVTKAAVGRPEFYRLDGSISFKEEGKWWVDVPASTYNQKDKAKARRLLQEAGYKGQPIRYMTTQEYDWMYKFALVAKQQLEEVGLKVDLQVVDWATLVKQRNDPDKYDAFTTGISAFADPTQSVVLSCAWPGWHCNAEVDKLLDQMRRETVFEKRYALWKEAHKIFYDWVPVIRHGDIFGLSVMTPAVKGTAGMMRPFFWNVWLEK